MELASAGVGIINRSVLPTVKQKAVVYAVTESVLSYDLAWAINFVGLIIDWRWSRKIDSGEVPSAQQKAVQGGGVGSDEVTSHDVARIVDPAAPVAIAPGKSILV